MSAAAKRVLVPALIVSLLSACSGSDGNPAKIVAPVPAPAPVVERQAPAPVSRRSEALPDFTRLAAIQGPAVVNVLSMRPGVGRGHHHEALRRHMPGHPPPGEGGPQQGMGSGFILSPDGLILTNAHLVAGAGSVTVRLADGKREYPGKVLGADLRSDVALLKIEASGLPVARLGHSAKVKPGEWVVAIGSPFGFRNTITAGIVSATDRDLPGDPMLSFIQTDVAVNPGNSGGPLINMNGEVVGINSMIYSGTGGYMGVSFAIPIEAALDVARQLQDHGKVVRGSLGVTIQPMTADLGQAFRLKSASGVLVSSVAAGGPAEKAGLKSGDVILEFEGRAVDGPDLPRLVAGSPPGHKARMAIWRNAARREIEVKIGETAPEPVPEASESESDGNERFDLVIREVPPAIREQLGIDYGLLVQAVRGPTDTPLRPGDVILAVNETRFSSEAEFHRILERHKKGDTLALLLRRGQEVAYVTVKMKG